MFPNDEPGWHGKIQKASMCKSKRKPKNVSISDCMFFEEILEREQQDSTSMPHPDMSDDVAESSSQAAYKKRTTVSCREYYVYKLQMRDNDRSYILRFGGLFQQYVVDNYKKIESMRLEFFKRNQEKLRLENYQGIMDSVVSGVQKGGRVGTMIYLPASFIGGPRDMRHIYLHFMALVQEFGKSDVFLTMTCNPNWPEIKVLLQSGEEAHNRPDLAARVFKAKLGIMNEKIMGGKIFGEVSSVVHVVEFQKRGLPHAHFLIILKPSFKYLTADAYDRIVSAELPDETKDPHLYALVVKHLMHGPCGQLNSNNVCMRDGLCKNHYPKEFTKFTTHGKGSYPICRRRNDERTVVVRRHTLDNRWVIPYNPTLLVEFSCHVNVELVCDIRAVKYLYKYIHKGHDKVLFHITPDSAGTEVDEISNYQDARWVSPVEATWRIFGFTLNGMNPSVLQLQLHLPNFQSVQFEYDNDLEKIL